MTPLPTVRTALSVLLMLMATTASAEHVYIYRWVDPADGDVHYAERPPPHDAYDLIATEGPPPPDAAAEQRRRAIEAQAEQGLIDERRQRAQRRQQAAEAAARRDECERLREWQAKLESRPGSRLLVIESEDAARRMTEGERQERLAETRERIGAVCQDAARGRRAPPHHSARPTRRSAAGPRHSPLPRRGRRPWARLRGRRDARR